jgi:peptidylprolyl isomerase domain and WD repeat-containing protein 1
MKVTLYQGKPMKNPGTQTGSNANLKKQTDPTLYSTDFKKNRFYIFSRRDPEDSESKGMSNRGN